MHTTLVGPVVLDIVQHFVERWNEIKKRKVTHNAFLFNNYSWMPCSTRMMRTSYFYIFSNQPKRTCKSSRFDWLALPHNVALAPNEAVVRVYIISSIIFTS